MDILTFDQTRLSIFDNFRTNTDLPKYKLFKDNQDTENGLNFLNTRNLNSIRASVNDSISSNDEEYNWGAMMDEYNTMLNCGRDNALIIATAKIFWNKLKTSLGFKTKKSTQIAKPQPDTINKIFANLIKRLQTLQSIAEDNGKAKDDVLANLLLEISVFDELIKQARNQGQTALAEETEKHLSVFLYECILKDCGFETYIEASDLIKAMLIFDQEAKNGEKVDVKRCLSGFQMTWLENFTRFIPLEISAKKEQADELLIFDNYVVLHYDPNRAAEKLTKKEKNELKKDPILFGVIENSNKLYFIGDWKDEFCDLTFKEIENKLHSTGYIPDTKLTSNVKKKLGVISNKLLDKFEDIPKVKEIAEKWLLTS